MDQSSSDNQQDPIGTPVSGPYSDNSTSRKGMSSSRVLLVIFGALAACLLICVVAGFFLIRSIHVGFEQVVEQGISAAVEEQIGATGSAQPGTYTFTVDDFLSSLEQALTDEGANIDALFVRILPGNQFELGIETEGQDLEYTATLAAIDGRLEVTDVDASNSFLNFVAPGRRIADGIESGVNDYLELNNLVLTEVSTTEGELTLVVDLAP